MSGAPAYAYEDSYIEKRERYELIDGEVYMMPRPSIDHVRIERNIVGIFDRYLMGKRCQALNEPDVHLSEDDHFIPDVVIVCNPEIITDQYIDGAPDLVVEVLSPSTARNDRMRKMELYAKYGVKEYWLVNPLGKSIEVYHLVEGAYVLDKFCIVYPDYEWKDLTEEEKAQVKSEQTIKVSLYDEFTVEISDIFRDVK